MKKRNLGSAGTTVSAIGIGAMSFSDFYGPTDTNASHFILDKALDLGIDHIDTSNRYGGGVSEQRIGSYLAGQGKQRHSMFKIATKAGITQNSSGDRIFDNSPEHLAKSLDESLKRLGVDQVELFYVHRREASRPIEEVTETLVSLVKTGKIRQFGFSEIAPTSLELAATIHSVGAVQSEYSLSTRSPELGLVQSTEKHGTSLVAFSPVGRSLLTDTPHTFEKSQTMDFLKANPRFLQTNLSRNILATERFRSLAQEMNTTSASLAIAWLLSRGDHIIPIPGTRSTSHLEELAAGAELNLSAPDLKAIDQVLPVGWAYGDRYSTAQWVGIENYC